MNAIITGVVFATPNHKEQLLGNQRRGAVINTITVRLAGSICTEKSLAKHPTVV